MRQGAFDGGVVEPQGNEAAIVIQRIAKAKRASLQLRPVGAERMGRHAEHEHAGVLQTGLDFCWDAVAGAEFPFIKPDLQPVPPQPLRHVANDRSVFIAVTEENVVCEIVYHDLLSMLRLYTLGQAN